LSPLRTDVQNMITAAQLRAARALLGIDQRQLAELSGLSVPTIQRMEASDGVIRGNVDSLMKLIGALDGAGIALISNNATSPGGGRGVRLKALPSEAADDRDERQGAAGPPPIGK
jgi:transcriptional regulator with XRE-family HTH domain